jgi:hypothetical protein
MATPLHEFFLRQAAEGDRPARHRHRRDAVLPLAPRFAAQMVNRSGSQLGGGAIKASSPASAASHRRGGTERDADNTLEHRTITMPADPGARIVPNEQRLNQILRGYMCEPAAFARSGSSHAGIGSVGANSPHRNRSSSRTRRSGVFRTDRRRGLEPSSAGRGVCGQDRFLDDQDEDRSARTTRHKPAGENIHGVSPSPSPAYRRRQVRLQRAYRPPHRDESPVAAAGRRSATTRDTRSLRRALGCRDPPDARGPAGSAADHPAPGDAAPPPRS